MRQNGAIKGVSFINTRIPEKSFIKINLNANLGKVVNFPVTQIKLNRRSETRLPLVSEKS